MSAGPEQRPTIEAAGALVWRRHGGRLQVLLVHRPRYDDWSWPKGKLERGETPAAAAAREVAEETGTPVVLGAPLPGLRYRTPEGRAKQVHYWAARPADDAADAEALAARLPVTPAAGDEVDEVAWLDVDAAAARLTRADDRDPLDALVAADADGRLDTHAVAVVRHGEAVPRDAWDGPDQDRPLTAVGQDQAEAAVPVLAAYGAAVVTTSRARRCAATVAPYVRDSGLAATDDDALGEDTRFPERAESTVRALLHDVRPSLLCTHRPVLPTVLGVLARHADRDVVLPPHDPYLAPGEILVAHVAGLGDRPRVVAVEAVGAVRSAAGAAPSSSAPR